MKTYDELLALITQRGVHAVFGDYGEGWGIEQNADELARFLVAMQALGVTSVLEIGTGYRAGLARFLHDDMGWEVVSVDIHDYGHQHEGITFLTLDEANNLLMFGKPDLLLLDGDHSYAGVKHDHEVYGHIAAKVIAFHDIAGLRDCEGVARYWLAIAAKGNQTLGNGLTPELRPGYYEIIASGDQRGGIGYIVLVEVEAPIDIPDDAVITGTSLDGESITLKVEGRMDIPEPPLPPAKPKPTRKPAARKPAAKKTAVKK